MKFLKRNIYSFSLIFFLFLVDRLSKYATLRLFENLDETNIAITSFLKFNLIWNDGIAFGLLSFDEGAFYNLLSLIITLITLILIYLMIKAKNIEKFGFCLIIGGSFGNIFDRFYYSSVIDFIDFHVGNFHWFIFNVADIFITIGVLVLIMFEFFKKNEEKN
ncbi:signal peptidase II [Candidatus Pelagibacter communis]|uniref:signal peptidase II n=1 Tax=Candidatus Pelagibacter TaxID=198251 RepID=UPI003EE2211F